jgi:phage gp45-like
MSRSPKEKLQNEEQDTSEERELYLRDGRKVVITEAGSDQLVEIRSESGMLELRIKLTEEGPVLQMESVRMQLKASEAVEIESKRIDIKATETVVVAANDVEITAEEDVDVDAKNDVRVVGKMIYLN